MHAAATASSSRRDPGRARRRGVAGLELDRRGVPAMTVLQLLRMRRFVDVKTAAAAIGCSRTTLRALESGSPCRSRRTRAALERVFGRPFPELQLAAPRLGLPDLAGDP